MRATATGRPARLLTNSVAQKQRALGYDADGYLGRDLETKSDGSRSTRTLAFDPFG